MDKFQTNSPVLTIAIPTYNRANYLQFLLSVLELELQGRDDVIVVVSDNCSTDETPNVVTEFKSRIPNLQSRRNSSNAGPDKNFVDCYFETNTPYIWLLGDDDAPLPGTITEMIKILREHQPDLLYLPSYQTNDICRDQALHSIAKIRTARLSREHFTETLHAHLTFTSGLVLRKTTGVSAAAHAALSVTMDTNLVQLAWVYETLKSGSKFMIAKHKCIIATTVNRGGYAALKVFITHHTKIAVALLNDQPRTLRAILSRTSLCHLPGLVWNLRQGRSGDFEIESMSDVEVPPEIAKTKGYRFLVKPIWTLSEKFANLLYIVSRAINLAIKYYDRRLYYGKSSE
jgi:abequosyltransferase